ncbi:GNAT family N-acetyltransferase [Cytophaga sp. FL35]|uniref:GNAT family N-acetyltransferase n=1 Tax=Cytophaga sp. FL35 TaxID=1904456 RepID=UPI001653917A|nr:GNAT family N-acetyltransferase [Cytophaga sp. FL35]MBC6997697.1 GNAT family N-acetyltransferase [Cytophaga sp. FL35]
MAIDALTEIEFTRCNTDSELLQILDLQRRNLPVSLSEDEKLKEGFVTVVHSFEILKEMSETCAHIIAKYENRVIAYALCMHPKFADRIEVLKPMFAEMENLEPKIENYMAMGQICVEKAHRKKGVFRELYRTMKEFVIPEFSSIITEVDAANQRSMAAHTNIGFEVLSDYIVDDVHWNIIQLK